MGLPAITLQVSKPQIGFKRQALLDSPPLVMTGRDMRESGAYAMICIQERGGGALRSCMKKAVTHLGLYKRTRNAAKAANAAIGR